ncbi:TRAM domain-containing protein, partial [Candidatus Gottesmanbacteria bacterium]|nr:TRAM domain-containing protein [Candidatus Gottesmanbacteria bacterium]
TIGQFTQHHLLRKHGAGFRRGSQVEKVQGKGSVGDHPLVLDTSVLIDGRILQVVNSGFIIGTLIIPHVVLGEVQHIADSPDSVRRAKGRRGLEVVGKLKGQKANPAVKVKVVSDDAPETSEVDHKLVALAKGWNAKLVTVDFNLAQYARAQGVRVLNVNDLAQALKMAIVPGEELTIKITHEGKEREQGVGYLSDGTMIVVDRARSLVGQDVAVVITKIHQTPAGQLFFARLK